MRIEPGLPPSQAWPPEGQAGARPDAAGRPFGELLAQARQGAPAARTVSRGDTLVSVVRGQAMAQGVRVSSGQALRLAHQVARDSGIANPDRIFPGQRLALDGLQAQLASLPPAAQVLAAQASSDAGAAMAPATDFKRQGAAAYGAAAAQAEARVQPLRDVASAAVRPVAADTRPAALPTSAHAAPAAAAAPASAPSAAATEPGASARSFLAGPHPVLEQTLDRAVARGFIPAIERGDVYDKILELAARHRFRPDDFARLTLMESDGLNPRASNERCHGIIQFCDGADRGAATAGYAANPRAILGFSVYQQLHLVDRYFTEVGIKTAGSAPASLDELYLAVLMPAARGTADPGAALPIPGPQASYLHVGRDRSAPITRQSILEGLRQNAQDRLSAYAQRMRPQALRDDTLPLPLGGTRLR